MIQNCTFDGTVVCAVMDAHIRMTTRRRVCRRVLYAQPLLPALPREAGGDSTVRQGGTRMSGPATSHWRVRRPVVRCTMFEHDLTAVTPTHVYWGGSWLSQQLSCSLAIELCLSLSYSLTHSPPLDHSITQSITKSLNRSPGGWA
eukprot:GHVU01167092.1.p2 GENE.GHVU01167092.1~~GHVU01167092.1.p2  ORF type:complete len:145 (+),score=2.12 GHVU01167092.1:497-931(+)